MAPCERGPGLSRRDVDKLLLVGAAAAALPACGDGTAGTVTADANHRATLTFAQFPSLASAGGSVVVDVTDSFPILVVRTGDATAIALSATCPHAYCLVEWRNDEAFCPCHRATFTSTGEVTGGPTTVPLPAYPATVGASGITVDLS